MDLLLQSCFAPERFLYRLIYGMGLDVVGQQSGIQVMTQVIKLSTDKDLIQLVFCAILAIRNQYFADLATEYPLGGMTKGQTTDTGEWNIDICI